MTEPAGRHKAEPGRSQGVGARFEARWLVAGLFLAVCATAGVIGTARAYDIASETAGTSYFTLFWLSQLVVLIPAALIATRPTTPFPLRVVILAGYGVFNYLPKLLMSPDHALYHDEFGHWRQAQNIAAGGELRPPNPFLPAIRDFPLLEWVTAGLHAVSGLSVWHAGLVVVALAHVATLLLVFWITHTVGFASHWAALAAFLYSLNPSFQYFDTQFSYESLGIPLALSVVAAALHVAGSSTRRGAWSAAGLGAIGALACVMTHHLSAAFMVGFCALVSALVRKRDSSVSRGPSWALTGWAAASFVAWLALFAQQTVSYVTPHVGNGFAQLGQAAGLDIDAPTVATVEGQATTRSLFAGSLVPDYEVVFSVVTVLVVFVLACVEVVALVKRRENARDSRMRPFLILTVLYFASLPFTLTSAGSEGAHRSWAFSYLGVAVVITAAVRRVSSSVGARAVSTSMRTAIVGVGCAALAMAAIGNVAAGQNVYYRFPGPYVFGTDTRFLTTETRSLLTWLSENVPSESGVVSDRFTRQAVTGFTTLRVPSIYETEVYDLYRTGDKPHPDLRDFLRTHEFDYFVLDRRIQSLRPVQPFFQGYDGPESVDVSALEGMRGNKFARPVHETKNYTVFLLDP